MRRVCCICGMFFGLKEPLDDDSETHGYCPECFELELLKIKNYKETGIDPWRKNEPTS